MLWSPTRRVRDAGRPRLRFRDVGAWEEIRTPDLRITNALLYRLSYPGAEQQHLLDGLDDDHWRRQNSINESIRSLSKQCLVDVRSRGARFASATASIARIEAPTRYSSRASPSSRALEALDHPVAIDVGQRGQPEAQFVDAKASLLALELRFDVAPIRDRSLTHLARVTRTRSSISSSWICCNGAIASSSARAISCGERDDVAGVPVSRSGTRRHCAMRWASSASRPSIRARRRLPFAALGGRAAASAGRAFVDEHLGDPLFAQALEVSPPRIARRSCRAPGARLRQSRGRSSARASPRATSGAPARSVTRRSS